MLFNSIEFALFLPIIFTIYWFVTNQQLQLQNLLIVFASYLFYGWWDYRFLSLIVFSTVVDYSVGRILATENNKTTRKLLLWLSLLVNLGFLGFFKYYNFFLEEFITAFSLFGTEIQANSLNIILPVGISFYTFQTLSYTIDVYKKKLEPTKDFIAFSAFVSFFPQLVAGPIERATNLLPQFLSKRSFDYSKAVDGLRQILWGFFQKVVIADNCAILVNQIFGNSAVLNGSTLLLGALYFTFQIYCDFAGYSNIAIGTSRLFGINLMQNFAHPYFSRNIAEFWRRWHISLSTWFRDYLYIPLGGSQVGTAIQVRNIFIIFIVSGFWHGSSWTFIVWGALNALYFLPLLLTNNNRNYLDTVAKGKSLPTGREFLSMLITFGITVLTWIFFRAESVGHAVNYISGIFSGSLFTMPDTAIMHGELSTSLLIIGFLLIEWFGREQRYAIEELGFSWGRPTRWAIYYGVIIIIILYGGQEQPFIYFQF